jgi:hypothetical protein
MGASQSTRSTTDYVYAFIKVNDEGYVHLDLFVYNIENALKVRMYMREKEIKETIELPPCDYWNE